MATAVKISDELAAMAKAAAAESDRSVAGQIEHWAKIGRGVEMRVPAGVANAMKRAEAEAEKSGEGEHEDVRQALSEAFAKFNRMGDSERKQALGLAGKTLFEPDREREGGIVRISPDGTRTPGRMEGRVFVPNKNAAAPRKRAAAGSGRTPNLNR